MKLGEDLDFYEAWKAEHCRVQLQSLKSSDQWIHENKAKKADLP